MTRHIVLDLFIFNSEGKILANSGSSESEFNSLNIRPIILYGKDGVHPIKQIKEYIISKELEFESLEMLPSLLMNKFDTEPDTDYLVLSFKVKVSGESNWKPDDMNTNVEWMDLQEFVNHPNLLPELKDKLFLKALEDEQTFYSGEYKESDGSNEVISKIVE